MRTNSKKNSDSEGKIKDLSDFVDKVHLEKAPCDPAGIGYLEKESDSTSCTQREAFLILPEEYRLRKDTILILSEEGTSSETFMILPGVHISTQQLSGCLRSVQLKEGPF